MSKAANRKNTADILKEQKEDRKRFFAGRRQQASNTGSPVLGNVSTGLNFSLGDFDITTGSTSGLSPNGGVMAGPLAFNSKEVTIASDKLTIASAIELPTTYVIVNGEGGNADDLKTIITQNVVSTDKGAWFRGQLLFLQAKNANITLKHNASGGNVWIPSGSDLTLNKYDSSANTGGDYAIFMFDDQVVSTSGKWVLVSSGASTSSSSGATRELDNLQNTAVNADIIPASASSVDLGSLTKPYDVTYSDKVVFVTEGAIPTNKPTIGWGNSGRGMTFSVHSTGADYNGWSWEHSASNVMSLTTAGSLAVANITTTGLLRSEGDTDVGNATTDTFTITARVDSDIIPTTTQSRDLGDTDRWWDKTYSMYVYTNRVTLSGSNAQINMDNNPINNCGDIDFDGTESIKRNGSTLLTFSSNAITTYDYADLVLGSAAYLKISSSSTSAPSGAFDGWFYVKNHDGVLIKVPYYDA